MIIDAINSQLSIAALLVFIIAYGFVITEEFTNIRKSKPVLLAAGIIWVLVALVAKQNNLSNEATAVVKHSLQEYGELLLFLLVAMTYVNVMEERQIFAALRVWLNNRNLSYRQLFWYTGIIAFFLSPLVDNLTTSLIMCAVVMAVGQGHHTFISLACINIVVSANAGGVFSPFGDITSLMIWQEGVVGFFEFFYIFIPAAVSFVIPATIMTFFLPKDTPHPTKHDVQMVHGAKFIMFLFGFTISIAVFFRLYLGLPPAIGMMTGLGFLKLYGYYLRMHKHKLDVIKEIESAEWDTLLFFYGIILCVGGLATVGYLHYLSDFLYNDFTFGLTGGYSATPANVVLGLISAVIDNIPVVYAVLSMQPDMSLGQWLLITLTAGIGGSLLSVGSAAGVALMGQAKKDYTFMIHLKWAPVILLGYAAGVGTHLWLNGSLF